MNRIAVLPAGIYRELRELLLMIKLKRVYEPPEKSDGERFFVERLWARGVSKEEARLTAWLKDLAPSPQLREWYSHEVEKWPEFKKRYREELAAGDKHELLADLAERAGKHTITLVYASKDTEHNSATILKDYLEDHSKSLTHE